MELDARDALLAALAEVDAPFLMPVHEHAWFPCTQVDGEQIFDCECGERRKVPLGSSLSPNDVPSALKDGGAIKNYTQQIFEGGATEPPPWWPT